MVHELFEALHEMEKRLNKTRYLCGNRLSIADIRLFTSLIRFDHVYYFIFKCNISRLQDFECLWNYTKELYQMPAFRDTTNMDHIKQTYYTSFKDLLNPSQIIPKGPTIDLLSPHNREIREYQA